MSPHEQVPEGPETPTAVPGTGRGGGRYRVLYRVDEAYQSTGHGDLIRALYDAFAKAALPVATSGAKHPRPKVAFGPPLPTGCTSAGEYFDLDLERGVDDLVGRINAAVPAGLSVVSAERIDGKAAPLSSVIDAAAYDLFIPAEVMASDDVEARLARFAGERLWQVQRASPKGGEKTVNLKRAVAHWSHVPGQGGSTVRVTVRLRDPDGNNANPALILSGLFRLAAEQALLVRARRVECYDANGQPISTAVWRGRRSRSLHTKSFEFLRFLDP